MEVLPALLPHASEVIMSVINWAVGIAVGIASFRRCRQLSRYPIWRSLLIGALAGLFWVLWLVTWWVNRDRIAQEWHAYRQTRVPTLA